MTITAKLILLGTLQITSYRATPAQTKPDCTDREHCYTAIGENVSELGVAISQDLLASGKVRYRDVLFIDGVGYRIVDDCLNARIHNAVDVFVYTKAEERAFGVRHAHVWLVQWPERINPRELSPKAH
jgi:3D (Asp-Asp-Asp) domain-containing protein